MQCIAQAKRFFLGFVCLFCFTNLQAQQQPNKTVLFLDSSDADYVAVYQGLPTAAGAEESYENVILALGWSAYDFSTTYNAAGYNGTGFGSTFTGDQRAAAAEIVAYVHSHGGRVYLSYGGGINEGTLWAPSYAISQSANWLLGDKAAIVTGLGDAVIGTGADGVFLGFQDPQPSNRTPKEFAAELVAFVRALRTAYPELLIIVGVQGQSWGRWQELFAKSFATCDCEVDNLFIVMFEYGIPQVAENSYPEQVVTDFQTYQTFGPYPQPTDYVPPPCDSCNIVPATCFSPGVPRSNNVAAWAMNAANLCLGLDVGALESSHGVLAADELAYIFATGPIIGPYAAIAQFSAIALWNLNQDAMLSPAYAISTAIREGLGITPQYVNYCTDCPPPDALVRRRGGSRALPISPAAPPGLTVLDDINLMETLE